MPIVGVLRDHLAELKAESSGDRREFVFASKHGQPFTPSNIRKRATAAWAAENKKRAESKQAPLVPIGLHECRHTFVSLMADAGLPLERIGDYVGHSIHTLHRYYIWSILQKKHFDEALAHTAAQADYRAVRIWGAVFLAVGLVLGTWGNLLG